MAAPKYDVAALDPGLRPARQPVARAPPRRRCRSCCCWSRSVFEWRAHLAALAGLVAALAVSTLDLRDAAADRRGDRRLRRRLRAPADRLDRGQRGLPLQPDRRDRAVRGGESVRSGRLSADRRIQALLVAFSFGAFIEGASGFGTPVAICSALLIGLGFTPLYAAGLSLIANTAPVAFGAIGTPILTLAAVTGIPAHTLGVMAGRQLPFVSLIVPAWLVVTMSGWRGLRGGVARRARLRRHVRDRAVRMEQLRRRRAGRHRRRAGVDRRARAVLARLAAAGRAGSSTAVTAGAGRCRQRRFAPGRAPQLRRSDAGACARVDAVAVPQRRGDPLGADAGEGAPQRRTAGASSASTGAAVVSRCCRRRGTCRSCTALVFRDYPVVPAPVDPARIGDAAYRNASAPRRRCFTLNWASATGTAILLAALATAVYLRISLSQFLAIVAASTLRRMRSPLATIMLMMSLGFVTRYGGTDATLGLAFTQTGVLYPFFAALLGWLGVALTGSDTSSNVLFGSLQKITAQQLGFNPVLIVTANSTGGVMGKMIDAQSIVVATASTGQVGQEGRILRFVFWHSVALVDRSWA